MQARMLTDLVDEVSRELLPVLLPAMEIEAEVGDICWTAAKLGGGWRQRSGEHPNFLRVD
jgi:hypothetical protein